MGITDGLNPLKFHGSLQWMRHLERKNTHQGTGNYTPLLSDSVSEHERTFSVSLNTGVEISGGYSDTAVVPTGTGKSVHNTRPGGPG